MCVHACVYKTNLGRALGDYYGRLVSWYTQGGFTDEYGVKHESNHKYNIDIWEVLNEPEVL